MPRSSEPENLSPLAMEILQYLWGNHEAEDTFVGVARWWILKQRIETMTRNVKQALDELVKSKFVVATGRIDGQLSYRVNRARRRAIESLLKPGAAASKNKTHAPKQKA